MAPRKKLFGDGGAGRLPTTRWTVVMAAGRDAAEIRRQALSELCAMYWTPVYGFIRAMGRRPDEARDLTQGFFTTRLLEKNDLSEADASRGKFRHWLLAAVKSYLANDLERARAKRHDRGTRLISINAAEFEGRYLMQMGHHVTPERIFERRWAMVLLEQTLTKLQQGYEKRGEGLLFEKMKPLLVHAGTDRYQAIAEELGMREEAFHIAVCRCRARFQDRIRAEVAETVRDEDEIEEELRYLHSGLQKV